MGPFNFLDLFSSCMFLVSRAIRGRARMLNLTRVPSDTQWTASVHTSHMSKPNVTRAQSATQWTASVHTSHISKPNVIRV